MRKKLISWVLLIAITVTNVISAPVVAFGVVSGEEGAPVFKSGKLSSWTGYSPNEGESKFFVEVTGLYLSDLSAEVSKYESDVYTPIAYENNRWFLGYNSSGEERYIYEMITYGGMSLESSNYYIKLKDSEGNYYDNNNAYFSPGNYTFLEILEMPAEIISNNGVIPYKMNIHNIGRDLTYLNENISVSLYTGTKTDFWSDPSLDKKIGSAGIGDISIVQIAGGSYYLEGEIALEGTLDGGESIFVVAEYEGVQSIANSSIHVVPIGGFGQFKLSNALAARSSLGGHESMNDYEAADDSVFYIGNPTTGSSVTSHKFTVTGDNISNKSLLTVNDNMGNNILKSVSLKGPEFGVYTLTGVLNISSEAEEIIFKYDGNVYHQTQLARTDKKGGLSVVLPGYEFSTGSYNLPEGTKEFQAVLSGLNLSEEATYSAVLSNYDDDIIVLGSNVINLDGEIIFDLVSTNSIDGFYFLELFEDGNVISRLEYYDGEITNWGNPINTNINFGDDYYFQDGETVPPALVRIIGNRSLRLLGEGFLSSKNYVACFKEHSVNGLSSAAMEFEAEFVSSEELLISSDITDNLARGWYEVYLKENGERINGFADAALLPVSDVAEVVNPTVKINNGESSTYEQSVTINITEGAFSMMRFSENENLLSALPFVDINSSITYQLSEGYGIKTIYFEFKSDNNNVYKTSAAINYISSDFPAPSVAGIVGIKIEEMPVALNMYNSYSLYIQSEGNYLGRVDLVDEFDNITTHNLQLTASNNNINTYSKNILFDDDSIVKIRYYLVDSSNRTSGYYEMPVTVDVKPYIEYFNTDFATFYVDNTRYIKNKSSVLFNLKGMADCDGIAVINYKDGAGTSKTSEVILESVDGDYKKIATVPNDAAFIDSVLFKLTDKVNITYYTEKTYDVGLNVASAIKFEKLPNTGNFDGKFLQIYNINGYSNYTTIKEGNTNFVFNKVLPGSYNYYLSDYYNTYKSGTLEVNSGSEAVVDLSDTSKPASLSFNVTGGEISENAYVSYSYTVNDSKIYGYTNVNKKVTGLYEGIVIDSYELLLPYEDLKKFKAPGEIAMPLTLVAGENTQEIAITDLLTRSITFTVRDKNLTSRVVPDAEVNFNQMVLNGSSMFFNSLSGTTNKYGQVTFDVYDSDKYFIDARKDDYDYTSMSLESLENEVDVLLNYKDQNKININSYILPLRGSGEDYDATDLLETQESIYYLGFTDGEGKNLYSYHIGNNTYGFNETMKDKTIRVYPYLYGGFSSTKEYYQVTMNEYGNGSVDIVSLPKGFIKADIKNLEDNKCTPYMLIYEEADGKFNLVSSNTGAEGKVSSLGKNLDDGNYTVLMFSSNDLKDLQGFSNIDIFADNGLIENIHYVKRQVNVESGIISDLGEFTVEKLLKSEMTAPFNVTYTTKFVPTSADGLSGDIYVKARVTVNELIKNKFALTWISTYGDSYGATKENRVNGVESTFGPDTYLPDDEGNYTITFKTASRPGKLVNKISLMLNSSVGEKKLNYYDTVAVETPQVSIIAPKQAVLPKAEIIVRGMAFAGSKVEIYDGNVLVGVGSANNNHSYLIQIPLTSPEKPGVHSLQAKMITPSEEEYNSKIVTCELIDGIKTAHVSNYEFVNSAHEKDFDSAFVKRYSLNSLSDNPGGTYTYNPYGKSRITFTVNNLVSSQLEEVYVINRSNANIEKKYPAVLVKDDVNGNYSDWIVEADFGSSINDISIFYSLKEEVDMGVLTGFNSPSEQEFGNALNNINNIEPASIPKDYRDNKGAVITEQTDTTLKAHKNFGEGKIGIEVNYTDVSGFNESDLMAQGFRKIPVGNDGEFYLIKDSSTTSGYNFRVYRTMYLSEGLTSMLKSGNTFASKGIMLASIDNSMLYASNSTDTARDVASKVDYVGYVENVGEISYEAFRNRTTDLGKLGTGMQVIGGVATVVQIFSGPASIDPGNLSNLTSLIKDSNVRSRLNDEIREYQKARTDSHSISSLMGVVSYGSGFFSLPGKCLSYVVSTGNMIYTDKIDAEYNIWGNGILAQITMQLRKEEKDIGKKDDPEEPTWIMDPSGYVFEAVKNNRVEGIKATVQTGDNDYWYDWNDEILIASDQENPQFTDKDGKYGWDVPIGNWRVMFEDSINKYQTALSKSMTVPPAHMEVNIGLVSTESPAVKAMAVDSSSLEVEFENYMQTESIYDKNSNLVNIHVFETISGLNVPCGKIEFIESAKNEGYKKDDIYQIDVIDSDSFVKKIRFTVDESLYPGGFKLYEDDGATPKKYTVEISPNVMSYAGVSMQSEYTGVVETGIRKSVMDITSSISGGSYSESQTVQLTCDTDKADIYYTINGSEPTMNSTKYTAPILISKSSILKAVAKKVGMNDSDVYSATYVIGDDNVPSVSKVSEPTANPKEGEYSKTINVSLATSTEGAKIYYTLDGTRPTASSKEYIAPIIISSTTSLKAIAVKDGYDNSTILTAVYTIVSGSSGGSDDSDDSDDKIAAIEKFKDISRNSWYYYDVKYVVEKELFKGIGENEFGPDYNMTRAMLVTVLHRLAGLPDAEEMRSTFKDVEKSSWYEQSVIWANKNNIVLGYNEDIFGVNDSVTREQLAVILYRYALSKGDITGSDALSDLNFADADKVSPWAKDALKWMVHNNILKGKNNNILDPLGFATRAEIAAILHRWLEL